MDGALKALVAGACAVVILGGVYFAYSKVSGSRADADEVRRSTNVAECDRLLRQKPMGDVSSCLINGYITEDDVRRAQ